MSVLLGAFILSFTVLVVVAVGILAAYGAVIVILNVLAAANPMVEVGKPVLISSQAHAAHAGGD